MFDEPIRDHASTAGETSVAIEETLLDRFNRQFRVVPADTPELVQKAPEIRYQVYCVERRFENPASHPDRREKDHFDAHSVHSLLIHRSSGQAVGTVRLVLPRPEALGESFAIQRVTDRSVLMPLPLHATAEVSRFSISKQWRDVGEPLDEYAISAQKWTSSLMSLGLIQTLVRMSARHGITHWCALMEPKLLRMLAAMAIHFKPLGARVEYHGVRQPCYCHVGSVLERVKQDRPMFFQILTDASAFGTLTLAA